MRAHLLVGLLLALALAEKPEEDLRVIQLSVGDLQGRQVTTKDGKTVYAYLGIPYANAPIGDLRFKAPETKRKWDGVLDATEYKASWKTPVHGPYPNLSPSSPVPTTPRSSRTRTRASS
uniref:COesterase domain-containing protein n=1 Tax=Steinernema glaseri TaxID=37863 RepID=A0A1I7YW66_9BILA